MSYNKAIMVIVSTGNNTAIAKDILKYYCITRSNYTTNKRSTLNICIIGTIFHAA